MGHEFLKGYRWILHVIFNSILIFYGDAELFASQCIKLAANLKEAGLPTDVYCGVDETQ